MFAAGQACELDMSSGNIPCLANHHTNLYHMHRFPLGQPPTRRILLFHTK